MATERTFSMIKPDATKRNLTGAITKILEDAGLSVVASKRVWMSKREAEGFYAVHKDRPFFGELVESMTSGPTVVQVLEGEGAILKLMEAVDTYIPTPTRATEKPFLMSIEDVFSITGRGTVGTGRVERGKVKVGEEIEIVGIKDTRKSVVTGIEMFRKVMDECIAGDNVGILLRGIEKDQIERGQVLAAPGSITPHKKFHASVYILNKEEGGRHTPFFKGYRPQFYFRTSDITGNVTLKPGVEMVMPGDNIEFDAELITPIALEKGVRFAIREGGHTVGAGVVTEVLA